MDKRVKDITGQRFGRLVVLGYAGRAVRRQTLWLCRCDCGTEKNVPRHSLIQGFSASCGCYALEMSRAQIKHGQSYNPVYRTWIDMRRRCEDPKNKSYANYGGRGITVCAKWQHSFEAFFDDVGPRPKGTSIERKDNDRGYEPDNVCWATKKEQSRNSRQTIWVEWQGKRRRLPDLAEEHGIPVMTVRNRLYDGWTLERALLAATQKE